MVAGTILGEREDLTAGAGTTPIGDIGIGIPVTAQIPLLMDTEVGMTLGDMATVGEDGMILGVITLDLIPGETMEMVGEVVAGDKAIGEIETIVIPTILKAHIMVAGIPVEPPLHVQVRSGFGLPNPMLINPSIQTKKPWIKEMMDTLNPMEGQAKETN